MFPDLPRVQARLERYLLRPRHSVLEKASTAVAAAGGCAVGVHLRHQASRGLYDAFARP